MITSVLTIFRSKIDLTLRMYLISSIVHLRNDPREHFKQANRFCSLNSSYLQIKMFYYVILVAQFQEI